jgi:hypothetical protein
MAILFLPAINPELYQKKTEAMQQQTIQPKGTASLAFTIESAPTH